VARPQIPAEAAPANFPTSKKTLLDSKDTKTFWMRMIPKDTKTFWIQTAHSPPPPPPLISYSQIKYLLSSPPPRNYNLLPSTVHRPPCIDAIDIVSMSLTALAVISRQGAPLYLHDYASNNNDSHHHHLLKFDDDEFNDPDDILFFSDTNDDNDAIITPTTSAKQRKEWPCRIKYQFVLHSACERLREILEDNMWKTPPSGGAMGIMDACWVGYLCSSDNLRAYGEFCE
jgi:hypothetical protein